MALGSPKYYSNMSNYPRALSSILMSLGLLAAFILFTSWILLSYPIGTVVRGYFSGVDQTSGLESPVAWDRGRGSEVGDSGKSDVVGTELPKSGGTTFVGQNQDSGDRKKPESEGATEVGKNRDSEDRQKPESEGAIEVGQNGDTEERQKPESATEVGQNGDTEESKKPESEGATEVGQNRDTEDRRKPDFSVFPGNDKMPGEQATEKPVPKKTSDSIDSGANDADSAGLPKSGISQGNEDSKGSADSECNLYDGEWFYDSAGPLYTNNSCPVITQMQNCQGNGRPDKEYESWRWKPSKCELPRFNATKFLELMSGKTLAFVGDSVARNQMESLLCLLWQVEAPKNRGNRHMQRWQFRSKSVMIVRIWSSWLVHQTAEPFSYVPEGVAKLHLDVPDEHFMEYIPNFDVVVLSSGHWFAKQSIYMLKNEIVGTQLWSPPKKQPQPMKVNSVRAFGISVETSLAAMVTHTNYTGLTIVRSYSPDHYEGGAWNTGGSCTGKVKPVLPGQLIENGFTDSMHKQQVTGFHRAIKKQTNRSKLKLMDITDVFSYRHDGHPGPYRSPDPNKITKRDADGKPPPQDCLHWCMPGPVDTWNELVLEIIRREFEGNQNSAI